MKEYRLPAERRLHRVPNRASENWLESWHSVHPARKVSRPRSAWAEVKVAPPAVAEDDEVDPSSDEGATSGIASPACPGVVGPAAPADAQALVPMTRAPQTILLKRFIAGLSSSPWARNRVLSLRFVSTHPGVVFGRSAFANTLQICRCIHVGEAGMVNVYGSTPDRVEEPPRRSLPFVEEGTRLIETLGPVHGAQRFKTR